jgi:transposase InsO family protein
MKNREDIFKAALSEMGLSFTSRDFTQAARRHGLPDKLARQGICAPFLHRECLQTGGPGTRTWARKDVTDIMYKASEVNVAVDFFRICEANKITGNTYDLLRFYYEVKRLFGN